jgi:hypothetical protein
MIPILKHDNVVILMALILAIIILVIEIFGAIFILPRTPKRYWCLNILCPVLLFLKITGLIPIDEDDERFMFESNYNSRPNTSQDNPLSSATIINVGEVH